MTKQLSLMMPFKENKMSEQSKVLPVQNIRAKILIVDDDKSYCKSIKRSLAFEKYDCVTTNSAKNALKLKYWFYFRPSQNMRYEY